ncbi:hypothetical protein CRM22_007433 [Opisthorchis felineus]|uniref:Elongation factor 1-beta n=1 Tax=Opisthorchis felineus TaxID=147828 RepID=A0A4S2LMT6_OPIFE|nr:hypothetical protein CRM22_007433 [Opisthorchis felineus]
MVFGDLNSDCGLSNLDAYLLTRSYVEGYQPSQADVVIYEAVNKKPSAKYENALRWYTHIESFGDERQSFPGQKKSIDQYGSSTSEVSTKASKVEEDDDDDLFGSDSGDEEQTERLRQERQAALDAQRSAKAAPVARSTIVLDVKPWDDETDMAELERCVRTITTDGLLWGSSKLVPLAYGIRKLQIGCVVEDDKVGTDFLEEEILKFEDLIQSVDVASFQKL